MSLQPNTTTTNTNTKNNDKENKTNTTSNVQNTTVENTTTENTVENTTVEPTNTETFEETPQTEEGKAISIVKKDWGGNNTSVKIEVEGINDDGTFIVTVRDSSTTEALAFYRVDVKSNSIIKKDIM